MNPPACAIRKARASDAPAILDCLREAFEPYRGSYTPEAFADTVLTLETLQRRFVTMDVFVAISAAGEIVGTIACSSSDSAEGYLRGMAIRVAWQGLGVAAALLRSVEIELLARGCSRITLDTTRPLQRAMRFYENQGFRQSGQVTDFFGMPLIEYVKILGPHAIEN